MCLECEEGKIFSFVSQQLCLWDHPNVHKKFVGSCLLLAAKFNGDMKKEKIKEVIEVWYHTYFVINLWVEIIMQVSSSHQGEFRLGNHYMQSTEDNTAVSINHIS